MADWIGYPDCLPIDVLVENVLRMPDPLWPGLGFAIAFIIGGALGAVIARCCLKDYLKQKVSAM